MKTPNRKEKKIYIEVKNDWVNTIVSSPEGLIDHLKDYYLDSLEDWENNEEVLTMRAVKMTEKEYLKLREWEP